MPIRSLADMREAGERIRRLGPRVVLVKGGHAEGSESIDVAVTRNGKRRDPRAAPAGQAHARHRLHAVVGDRREPGEGNGRASAIRARARIPRGAIRHAPGIGGGHGPLNHVWRAVY